ncbi:MAG: DUF4124 domain-containing protein [Proteobacteria bacterium]|nr:DUF4124 domain-containing protein [Pseudomonadota bacterium]
MNCKIDDLIHGVILSIMLFFCVAGGAYAVIYKWTDAEGNVHYGEQPPTDRDVEIIKQPAKVDSVSGLRELRQQTIRANKLQQARQRAAEEKHKKAEYLAIKKDNCQQARTRLDRITNSRRLRAVDADGNVTRTTEQEHQARITTVSAQVDEWCN